ncbi:MAG: hypothetical protein AABY22_04365 [Nanoarchaeota archaeon]
MGDLEQIKRDYVRGKQILDIAIDADNHSMEAILIKRTWTPWDLENLCKLLESWEDQGLLLTIKSYD